MSAKFYCHRLEWKCRPSIQDTIEAVIKTVENAKIPVIAFASEGDEGYNRRDNVFRDDWDPNRNHPEPRTFLARCIERLKKMINNGRTLPLGDILHLLKNIRAQLKVLNCNGR
jgi:hypothetical protein